MCEHLNYVRTEVVPRWWPYLNVLWVEVLPHCEVPALVGKNLYCSKDLGRVPCIFDHYPHREVWAGYERPGLQVEDVDASAEDCGELGIQPYCLHWVQRDSRRWLVIRVQYAVVIVVPVACRLLGPI